MKGSAVFVGALLCRAIKGVDEAAAASPGTAGLLQGVPTLPAVQSSIIRLTSNPFLK
jgi:hypothetical protein